MLVHIYTGQNIFFIRIKEAFHTVVSPDATICIALRDLSRWLTPLLASPNATFRVTKHDLLRRNQWLKLLEKEARQTNRLILSK